MGEIMRRKKKRDRARRQKTHFLCLHGAHDNGTLFLFLTTRYCVSGEFPVDDPVEGGVGDIFCFVFFSSTPAYR